MIMSATPQSYANSPITSAINLIPMHIGDLFGDEVSMAEIHVGIMQTKIAHEDLRDEFRVGFTAQDHMHEIQIIKKMVVPIKCGIQRMVNTTTINSRRRYATWFKNQ
ncbi:hypothetical protein RSOLAG1IB_02376 [Rhizoctonia solani AG-1 IB]|uniref:Uncharacterized protein n=1 Tax=Thanatephorus cucumeris (strain AG1-IB / isolate 7/3/14) TaxID=1108050 RepID=A0A0B7FN45_THACB|nr:hypothetical protein RSOLAG1IB_02376 [Rhizoctonia solani AG-1 IB]